MALHPGGFSGAPNPALDSGLESGLDSSGLESGLHRDWFFWALLAAAIVTRGVWVIWVHPPREALFSDMAHYLHRARLIADAGLPGPGPTRDLVWQPWGTHALLALPLLVFGDGPVALAVAEGLWAVCAALTVALGYGLGRRALAVFGPERRWPARALGLALLAWLPLLSHAGYFSSEAPFTCALLALTLGLGRLIETGRGAAWTGLAGALAFCLRPQVGVFLGLSAGLWAYDRLRARPGSWSRRVCAPQALAFALPLALVVAVSAVRMRVHAGHWGGVSESATMNLTAGRCHNIVTHAFPTPEARAASEAGEAGLGQRVSLPGFRALERLGETHPLGLRPALGGETLAFVGPLGDPEIHRGLRAQCRAATGLGGQLRYATTHVAMLWTLARPWPESGDHGAPWLLPASQKWRRAAAWIAPLAVSGLGLGLMNWMGWTARRPKRAWRDRPEYARVGAGLAALQLISLVIVAALFFGSPRLRAPYDPYLLLGFLLGLEAVSQRLRGRDLAGPGGSWGAVPGPRARLFSAAAAPDERRKRAQQRCQPNKISSACAWIRSAPTRASSSPRSWPSPGVRSSSTPPTPATPSDAPCRASGVSPSCVDSRATRSNTPSP